MNQVLNSQARERVLDAAEQLFAERGYSATKLKDIASAVGIRHASLYHHVPGGKEQLYIEVLERTLSHHKDGIEAAIRQDEGNLRAQLQGIANWLLSHPPMDFIRMQTDTPPISEAELQRLGEMALNAIIEPLRVLLESASNRGEIIKHQDIGLVAGGIIGMIQSLHSVPEYVVVEKSRQDMANELIDVVLYGLIER